MNKFLRRHTSLGSKVTWAVKDKKKFKSLIYELDFLITNLERVSHRLRQQYAIFPRFTSSQDSLPIYQDASMQSMPSNVHTFQQTKAQCDDCEYKGTLGREQKDGQRNGHVLGVDPKKHAPSKSFPSSTEPDVCPTCASAGNVYKGGSTTDNARQINGNAGASGGPGHTYENHKAEKDSLQLNGDTSVAGFEALTRR